MRMFPVTSLRQMPRIGSGVAKSQEGLRGKVLDGLIRRQVTVHP